MSWTPFDFGESSGIDVGIPKPEETKILVVDDDSTARRAVARLLKREGYAVEAFETPTAALEALITDDTALLVSDLVMPGMTGVELARRALEENPDLAVIILTGAADTDTAIESLRLGIEDYLTKPIDIVELRDSVERSLRRRAQSIYRRKLEEWLRKEVTARTEEVRRYSEDLERVSVATLSALVRAMEAKDAYLRGHSERVAWLAERIARRLGLAEEEIQAVRTAGLLHDLGMIAVQEAILAKNGPLTDEEYAQVRRHPELGAGILQPLGHLETAVEYVRYHHERLNGSGYPEGLKGDRIPLGAQIVGLAESFVAITEERPFRPAYPAAEALETLKSSEGVWYGRRLLEALEAGLAAGG